MTHDIVFIQKIAELDFKNNQKLGARVFQSVFGIFRDGDRFIDF